ncbi:MAG TPA: hypothetical protein VG934_03210 [Candidatus Paceibacterota bacterium]|nr:hypothetical protein [Candidatus Paceibacterota bacterium]
MELQTKHTQYLDFWACVLPWLISAAALFAIALYVFVSISAGSSVWDDSLMFVRYAHNVLSHGAIAWNNNQPTYGLTSLAYLLLVVPLANVFSNAAMVVIAASICGFALFLAVAYFLIHVFAGEDRKAVPVIAAIAATALALGHSSLASIIASGMDTTFGIAYLVLYLAAVAAFVRSGSDSKPVAFLTGMVGGCAYAVRPDLLIYSVIIPVALAIWSDNPALRRNALIMMVATVGTALAAAGAAWMYFGTPLPLPFYAKSGLLYDPTLAHRYRFFPIFQLITHIDAFAPLWLTLPAALVVWRREFFHRTPSALLIGIALSVMAVATYYLFFVIQIMPYEGRFYYPVLPGLIALLAALMARGWSWGRSLSREALLPTTVLVACAVCGALLVAPLVQASEYTAYALLRERGAISTILHGTTLQNYEDDAESQLVWPCLDAVDALPPTASVATTEVGLPGVLAPFRPIIDLAGLNDTQISLREATPADRIKEEKVDVVYLPTEYYYPVMRSAILAQPWFTTDYTIYPATSTGGFPDVAVRKGSLAADPMAACMQKFAATHSTSTTSDTGGYYYLTLPFPLGSF